jgi:hypothetical protein
MASRLERLVPAGGYFLLSRPERRLLRFALDRFGEPLARFLLSGTGEEAEARSRRFTVTFTDQAGTLYQRGIRVIADERGGIATPSLPRRKEPLVMLALLRLLIDVRQTSSFDMRYRQEEILALLGWEGTEDNRLVLDEAVRRYNSLRYEWSLEGEELAAKGYDSYDGQAGFITGYAFENAEAEGEVKRAAREVRFSGEFVKELMGRSLFGVNWDKVSAVESVAGMSFPLPI